MSAFEKLGISLMVMVIVLYVIRLSVFFMGGNHVWAKWLGVIAVLISLADIGVILWELFRHQ